MTEDFQIDDTISIHARRAAIINGLLSLLGIVIASIVYLKFPHPAVVEHISARDQSRVVTDGIETYMFLFPAFQVWLFVMPASAAWFPGFRRSVFERQKKLQKKFPADWVYESPNLYSGLSVGLVVVEAFFLLLTTYRSVLVATNNI